MYTFFMHTTVQVSLFRSEDCDNRELHVFPLKYSGSYKVHIVKSSWFALRYEFHLSSLRITVRGKGISRQGKTMNP